MRTLDTEMAAQKYAHVERERRWLVDKTWRPTLTDAPHVRIDDRYIDGTRLRLRRMIDSVSGAQSLKLGKKYETDDPLARPTVTTYLSEAEYALMATLPAHAIAKRRYAVQLEGRDFSIDLFEGALSGLELSEIEADADAALRSIAPPPWALRDVSTDSRYQGGNLALHGIPKEKKWPSS